MIMWGGFKYLVSRGDKASIESAKTQMISAVTGVVLAFGTYTLLYLINPALLTINTPNLPGIQGGDNVNLEQDATAGGGSPISPASLLPNENVLYSTNNSDWNAQHALSGTPTFVNTATTLMNNLQSQGKLPPGAIVTSGWRSGTGTSWHHTGQAFDMTWPGITQDNAQSFVNAVIAENPNLSYIIETNGENGSTWTSYGMGVHIDARPGTPYREQ